MMDEAKSESAEALRVNPRLTVKWVEYARERCVTGMEIVDAAYDPFSQQAMASSHSKLQTLPSRGSPIDLPERQR